MHLPRAKWERTCFVFISPTESGDSSEAIHQRLVDQVTVARRHRYSPEAFCVRMSRPPETPRGVTSGTQNINTVDRLQRCCVKYVNPLVLAYKCTQHRFIIQREPRKTMLLDGIICYLSTRALNVHSLAAEAPVCLNDTCNPKKYLFSASFPLL